MRAQQPVKDQRQDLASPSEPRKAPRSLSGLYLASWAVLAALSATYIAVVLTQPDWATPLTTQSLPAEPDPAIAPAVQQLTDEVGSLRKSVADLQRELDEVKSTASVQQEPEAPFRVVNQEMELARLDPEPSGLAVLPQVAPETAATEAARPDVPQAKASEPAAPLAPAKPVQADTQPAKAEGHDARKPKLAKPAATPAKASPPEPITAAADRKPHVQIAKPERNPVKKVVVLNAKPAEELNQSTPTETGSLPPDEPPLITFGPPTITHAAEAVAIHLDAGPSLQALKLRWSVLHDRHRSALRDLQPRYLVSGTAQSPSFLLMAGPISTPDEAIRICALLRARSVPCSVGGPFVGQAL